ncbi:MAG TPA: glycosyltransferase family 9 protein [Micromonospora sp.]
MADPELGLVPDVERIAVLRANALGDFLFALPALEALRAAYPTAEVVLLGAPWHARWLAGRPSPVARVMVVPPAPGIRDIAPQETPPAPEEFFARARAERFDVALQLHGGGRHSNPLVSALGARLTAGLRASDAPPLDRWLRYDFYQPEVIRLLETVALVGASPVTLTPRVEVTATDVAEARRVIDAPRQPRAALHPGVTDPRRRWPPERFAAVADGLAAQGFEVVVTGTEGERPLVERVVAAARAPIRSLVGALSLGGLAAVYAECAVVVANDTGPLHLAGAVGTPTVGIFWAGNMITVATPLRGRHRALASWTIHCPECGEDCTRDLYPDRPGEGCAHRVSFVSDVPVSEVLAAVDDLTRAGGAGPRHLGAPAVAVGRSR